MSSVCGLVAWLLGWFGSCVALGEVDGGVYFQTSKI